ncbi:MAG: hypothetical protein ABSC56_11775 [Solirubrobacteraceae bacterium]
MLLLSLPAPASAKLSGILPPRNPPANIAPEPNYDNCSANGYCTHGPPCYSGKLAPDYSSQACESAELAAINHARAKEGVAPMVLPTNFNSLTGDEQLLVVIDLERVGRGLPPFAGIVAALDGVAQSATRVSGAPAGTFADPTFPSGFVIGPGSAFAWKCSAAGGGFSCGRSGEPGDAIAAGGQISALDADYGWMYGDGYGAANDACKTPGSAGCWGHRDNILGSYPTRTAFSSPRWAASISVGARRATTLAMGAGSLQPNGSGGAQGNWTAIFTAVSGRRPRFVYTWTQAVAAGAR